MEKWIYEFPTEWNNNKIPWYRYVEHEFLGFFKELYWRYWKTQLGGRLPQFLILKPSRETGWSKWRQPSQSKS
ncbi:MAG: hypothetical protein WA865_03715 [Spirulinaceae cyanobacterium]